MQKRGSRLGQASGTIAVDGLFEVITAGVVALAGEGALLTQEAGRLGVVRGPAFDRAHLLAHRFLGLGAFLGDVCGSFCSDEPSGPHNPLGIDLAVGGLEDAGADLRRHQRRAVQKVEGERAGRNVGLEIALGRRVFRRSRQDRFFTDDVHEARLGGIGDALARKTQLVDRHRRVVAGNLEEPRLAVQEQ